MRKDLFLGVLCVRTLSLVRDPSGLYPSPTWQDASGKHRFHLLGVLMHSPHTLP